MGKAEVTVRQDSLDELVHGLGKEKGKSKKKKREFEVFGPRSILDSDSSRELGDSGEDSGSELIGGRKERRWRKFLWFVMNIHLFVVVRREASFCCIVTGHD